MRFLSLIFCVFACALTSCKTTRTVLSGPTNVSSGSSGSYNPEKERAAGEAAVRSGVQGQFGQGDSGFQERFGKFDPGGYIQTKSDPKDPTKSVTTYGLNSMSDKNFGGSLNSKDMKSFTQSRDFLTRKYNTQELSQKDSSAQGVKSWFANKKANADRMAHDSGAEYSGSGRTVAGKTSSSDGRTVTTGDAREQGKAAMTKNYYPASKALDNDAPKIIGQGSKGENDSVWKLIKSRPRDNPATVEDIRALLGKSN